MPRPPKLKMTLADLMILVAATAVSLGIYLLIDDTLYGGGRFLFGLFTPPQRVWDSREILDRASGLFALIMTMLGAWTFAVPLLAWLRPRPVRYRLVRGAGTSACLATCFGIMACVGATGLAFSCRWLDGWKPLHPNF